MAKRKATTKRKPVESREAKALRAKLAQINGESLNRQQQRDVAWYDKTQADEAIANWCSAVPKGDYCRLSGRQHKLVDDAARLYGLPIGESTIDLRIAITALHDLIAANANRIRGSLDSGDRDELEAEKLRQQIAKLGTEVERLQISLAKDRGDAIPRQDLRQALVAISAAMREYGRAFARISPEARDLWNDTCNAIADEIETGRLKW
ncbi:hypothetical protein RMSM_05301 [Rhodopirellula maiorica SM1]|uniref:Uncharacterized protein n=1 Tax=Rhodopirellula maiorica SM1 TaxID=1265738 RepID=M5REH3_9BACT|nr:hypothetical protein [Rhodopirellula maiorica]EMI17775.1 hypothetical protein RMSM_05301 [Rhodopirellula maiorica SM1]